MKFQQITMLILSTFIWGCSGKLGSLSDGVSQNEISLESLPFDDLDDSSSPTESAKIESPSASISDSAITDSQAKLIVRHLFVTILGRRASPSETRSYISLVKGGNANDVLNLATRLVNLPQYAYHYDRVGFLGLVHSLYSGFLGRCSTLEEIQSFEGQLFIGSGANRDWQSLILWATHRIQMLMSSREFVSQDRLPSILKTKGRIPVCIFGQSDQIQPFSSGEYTVPLFELNDFTIQFKAIGGNGILQGRYLDSVGGPYNFVLSHTYTLNRIQLERIKYLKVWAESAGFRSEPIEIRFEL